MIVHMLNYYKTPSPPDHLPRTNLIMYFTREKSTYRIPGVIFNGILALYCILGTVLLLGAFAFFRIFHKSFIEAFLILAAVLFTEAALSAITFIPAVSNGENSALVQNIFLLLINFLLFSLIFRYSLWTLCWLQSCLAVCLI